ncbi:universal stress protein [Desulforhabdus amnigena]|jgi:nucleotide-binding universal stress UspA family protein|uniref:UspA domain-containing protein n=1 Tax=Desulforhabdus amnigena TaxID=40218 RepID=A0A9W6CZ25_9BACT|nr:universal stress protein [Desulforhabdus amnigena]NLJ29307.1 universal stress protein [Deltaproteobacteria bacterium]GLI34426.1 hypothetical protein DAMNIGENAA_18590 [Desulforhabdus amnigena]
MERILVSMSALHGAWEAWSRAISLAKRIDARVYTLLVSPRIVKGANVHAQRSKASIVRNRLELLIEAAKLEGIQIDFFISEGNYDEEVIRFVELNKITLLVVEHSEMDMRHTDPEFSYIQKIRHRIKCRVEMVTPRKIKELKEREG